MIYLRRVEKKKILARHNKVANGWLISFIKYRNRAICKSRHWNLSIGIGIGNGIGIGTDITNAIISSSIRPMDPKLSRVVT